jgi:hypothetical protein
LFEAREAAERAARGIPPATPEPPPPAIVPSATCVVELFEEAAVGRRVVFKRETATGYFSEATAHELALWNYALFFRGRAAEAEAARDAALARVAELEPAAQVGDAESDAESGSRKGRPRAAAGPR